MSGCGWEVLPDVSEWLGAPPGCPGVVGRPSQMTVSGLEARMGGWEALPEVREWSGGPLGSPGVVAKPSRMSGFGREDLPDVRVWSVGRHGCQ